MGETERVPNLVHKLAEQSVLDELTEPLRRLGCQVEDHLFDVADHLLPGPCGRDRVFPEARVALREAGGEFGQQRVATAIPEETLLFRIVRELDARPAQEREERRLLPVHQPRGSEVAVLEEQVGRKAALLLRAIEPLRRERQVENVSLRLPFCGCQLPRRPVDLMLDPELAVSGFLVVLEQREGRGLVADEVLLECRNQSLELALLVAPERNSGLGIPAEKRAELLGERGDDHSSSSSALFVETTLAMRRMPASWSGRMLTLTPSSMSGSQPFGCSLAFFHGTR